MHRNLIIYLSALSALSPNPTSALRHGAHQLRDVFAYPKYQVQYLNDLPLAASDAERCKALGIETEEEWMGLRLPTSDRKRLSGGGDSDIISKSGRLGLIPMNFSPGDEADPQPYPYLCLMPSSNTTWAQTARMDQVDEMDEIDPIQGWASLSHLDGKCLYSRQEWFTYSYCHNSHIRQFRQAAQPHPHPPGGFVPQEDTEYDAYTLGQAHPAGRGAKSKLKKLQGQGQSREVQAQSHNQEPPTAIDTASHDHTRSVSFGLGASSRYLVQKWSDGTRCDKTGQPRQVEIQVHCSRTTGDIIYMVKELAICSYVVIIHSPHLCALPGFKAEHTEVEMAPIRCRQVVPDEDFELWSKGESEKEKATETEKEIQLGLPFSDKPAGAKSVDQENQHRFGLPPLLQPAEQHINEPSDVDTAPKIILANLDTNDETLRDMLTKALEMLAGRKRNDDSEHKHEDGDGGEAEELVLVSWEEDADGAAVLLEAEVLGDGEKLHLNEDEKEALQKMVREYISGEEEEEEDEEGKVERLLDEL